MFGLGRKNGVLDITSEQPIDIKQQDLSGKIIIRTIELSDKESARELMKAHHASTLFAEYAFSDRSFDKNADKIFSKPDNLVCLVAELDGELVGLLMASAGAYALSDELILTTCLFVVVHPTKIGRLRRVKTFLRLIKAVKLWSNTRGASQVLVHVTAGTNITATDRLLRRSGAKCIGGGYVV